MDKQGDVNDWLRITGHGPEKVAAKMASFAGQAHINAVQRHANITQLEINLYNDKAKAIEWKIHTQLAGKILHWRVLQFEEVVEAFSEPPIRFSSRFFHICADATINDQLLRGSIVVDEHFLSAPGWLDHARHAIANDLIMTILKHD